MMLNHVETEDFLTNAPETMPNGDPVPSEAARPHCTGVYGDGKPRYDVHNFGVDLAYIMDDGDVLCGKCVHEWADEVTAVQGVDDSIDFCGHCNGVIGDESRITLDHCRDGAAAYILRRVDGRDGVRLDFTLDLVRVAEAFGFRGICPCGDTDGTVDCAHAQRDDMYVAAIDFLDRVAGNGDTAPDPGYFAG